MPRSSIRRIFNAVVRLRSQGTYVYPLHIGDPYFAMPQRMVQGITAALAAGRTHYSPTPGVPELRGAIAAHVARRLQIGTADELAPCVVCSQGATQALNACLQLTCDCGDSMLFPEVHFPNYMQQCCLAGVEARLYPLDAHFQPDLGRLEVLIDSTTMALLINSPSNPTGAVFHPETMAALYEIAARHSLWVITDEAYIDYVYDGEYRSPLAYDWERAPEERRVLGVFSFSKSYAATGLRMGWTVCPREEVAIQLGLMNDPLTGSLTTPLQYGMIAALEEDDVQERRSALSRQRDLAVELLASNGWEIAAPGGGMFCFLDVSHTGLGSDEFADRLLAEEHVAVVPGSGFGLVPTHDRSGGLAYSPGEVASRCVRVCFAIQESDLREGVTRLGRFVRRLASGH